MEHADDSRSAITFDTIQRKKDGKKSDDSSFLLFHLYRDVLFFPISLYSRLKGKKII